MRECLKSLKQAPSFLQIMVLRIKQDRAGSLRGGIEFMELCGFEKMEGGYVLFLTKGQCRFSHCQLSWNRAQFRHQQPFLWSYKQSSGTYRELCDQLFLIPWSKWNSQYLDSITQKFSHSSAILIVGIELEKLRVSIRLILSSKPHVTLAKEEKSNVHEKFVNNISGGLCKSIALMAASMSVSINLMNRTEFEMLRQVLVLWIRKMTVLEITFKDNNNASNESWEKNLWEKDNNNNVPFPNAKFRVKTLWMPNFSGSEEEFAFV
ncbi:unnamed protein product [Brassica napus]|uniref:(rape) hypothetical protein n=1 Tax=Brassica napus TaxID=3708 RepID=A0A817B6Q0_BRANA|nr:unnamed protein product [Brassica napus]